MVSLSLILFIAIIGPLTMMLFVFKDRSRTVLLFFIIGVLACLFAGGINGIILNCFCSDQYYLTLNITPVVEEVIKGLPILFFTFVFRPKKQLLLECAVAVGVGFALLENAIIFSNSGNITLLFAVARGFGAGIMHGVCTFCVGYGMHFIYTRKKLFYTGTITLLTVSIVYHSIYNALVQSKYEIVGLLLPIATFIPIMIINGKKHNNEKK